MELVIRGYTSADLPAMVEIWNQVVEEGLAFPQEEFLDLEGGRAFFAAQSHNGVAVAPETGEVVGLYILHPNNVGRCGLLCNASYAVTARHRGRHIGEILVLDSLEQGRRLGFRVMQFNAVVADNLHARHLYQRLGFQQLGTIPGGFRQKDGAYVDICPYYRLL